MTEKKVNNNNDVPKDLNIYKLRGIASFPFLWEEDKKGRTKYSDDKFKITVTIDKDKVKDLPIVKGIKDLAEKWYGVKDMSIFEATSIVDLDIDLDEDDKYAAYKRNRIKVTAKRSNKQGRPTVYDTDTKAMSTQEDYGKVTNGSEVNVFVNIYCYGEKKLKQEHDAKVAKVEAALDVAKTAADKKKFTKMLTELSKKEPAFGITLGLHSVQFLAATKGRAAMDAAVVGMLDVAEVQASDLDTESGIEELEQELSDTPVEDADVNLNL